MGKRTVKKLGTDYKNNAREKTGFLVNIKDYVITGNENEP